MLALARYLVSRRVMALVSRRALTALAVKALGEPPSLQLLRLQRDWPLHMKGRLPSYVGMNCESFHALEKPEHAHVAALVVWHKACCAEVDARGWQAY